MNIDLKPFECYQIARQLKSSPTASTLDGWVVSYAGDKSNAASQRVIARKDDKEIILKHYYGSEGIAQVLLRARNAINSTKS